MSPNPRVAAATAHALAWGGNGGRDRDDTTSTRIHVSRRLLARMVCVLGVVAGGECSVLDLGLGATAATAGSGLGSGGGGARSASHGNPWNVDSCRGAGTADCGSGRECLPAQCEYQCYDPAAWNCTSHVDCPSGEICAATPGNFGSAGWSCVSCDSCLYRASNLTQLECFGACGPCARRGDTGSACADCDLIELGYADVTPGQIGAARLPTACTDHANCSVGQRTYCSAASPGCGLSINGVCEHCDYCLYIENDATKADCFMNCGGCLGQGGPRSACSNCTRTTALSNHVERFTDTVCTNHTQCASGLYCAANSTDCGRSLCSVCDYCLYEEDDALAADGGCLAACGGCADPARAPFAASSACASCHPGSNVRLSVPCTNTTDCWENEYCGRPTGCGGAFCTGCDRCLYETDDIGVDGACFAACGSCTRTGARGSACAIYRPPTGELCGGGALQAIDWSWNPTSPSISAGKRRAMLNRSTWSSDDNYYVPAVNITQLCFVTVCGASVVVSNLTTLPNHWFELTSSAGAQRDFGGFFVDSARGTVIGTPTLASPTSNHISWALVLVVDRHELLSTCAVRPHLIYDSAPVSGMNDLSQCSSNNLLFEVYRASFNVSASDTSTNSNGPNGEGCRNGGIPIDGTEFDGSFTCNCSETTFIGENCDIHSRLRGCRFQQLGSARRSTCVETPCAVSDRSRWAVNSTYRIAGWRYIGGCRLTDDDGDRINITSVTFESRDSPHGVCIDGRTGSMTVTLSRLGSNITTIVASLGDAAGVYYKVDLAEVNFTALVRDLDNPAATGPDGLPCHGKGTARVVDNTTEDEEFDLTFRCECRHDFAGPRCSRSIAVLGGVSKERSGYDSDDQVLAASLATVVFAVGVILVVIVIASRRWRRNRDSEVDFTAEIFRVALPPKYSMLDVDEIIACKCCDGVRCQVGLRTNVPREIKRSHIILMSTYDTIGTGEFGSVTKRIFDDDLALPNQQNPRAVAVKELRPGASGTDRQRFLVEAFITAQFRHENVVSLVGVVTAGEASELPIMLVLELCERGSLDRRLAEFEERIPVSALVMYCVGVANGMHYLTLHSFIHRDLAARNVLVDANDVAKVADFGLTRELDSNYYYRSTDERARIPLRWTSPEAVLERKFSEASDVWAFGVTAWEIFSSAATPYGELTNDQLLERVIRRPSNEQVTTMTSPDHFGSLLRRHMLKRPPRCPEALFEEIIAPSLQIDPSQRPTFATLAGLLANTRFTNFSGSQPSSSGTSPSPFAKTEPFYSSKPPILPLSMTHEFREPESGDASAMPPQTPPVSGSGVSPQTPPADGPPISLSASGSGFYSTPSPGFSRTAAGAQTTLRRASPPDVQNSRRAVAISGIVFSEVDGDFVRESTL